MRLKIAAVLMLVAVTACKARQSDSALRDDSESMPPDLSQLLAAIEQDSGAVGESIAFSETEEGDAAAGMALTGETDVRVEILQLEAEARKIAQTGELTEAQKAAGQSLADNLELLLQLMAGGTLSVEQQAAVTKTIEAVRAKLLEKPKPKGPVVGGDMRDVPIAYYQHSSGSWLYVGGSGRYHFHHYLDAHGPAVQPESLQTKYIKFSARGQFYWFAPTTADELQMWESATDDFTQAAAYPGFKRWVPPAPAAVVPPAPKPAPKLVAKPVPKPVYHCSAAQRLTFRYITGQRARYEGSMYYFMLAPSSRGNPRFTPDDIYTVNGYVKGDTLFWCD